MKLQIRAYKARLGRHPLKSLSCQMYILAFKKRKFVPFWVARQVPSPFSYCFMSMLTHESAAIILDDIERHRASIRGQFEVLREGWNGDAVAAIKTARKDIDKLEKEFEFVNEAKSRVKAMYKLRGSSSSALSWKGSQALGKLWDAMVHYTDPYVDPVLAESNARGGPMEADLIAKVSVADITPPLDLITVEDVVKWVDEDESLGKNRENTERIKAALVKQQITGRMLMHLAKGDMMRMGIQVINAMPLEPLLLFNLPLNSCDLILFTMKYLPGTRCSAFTRAG